MRKPLSLAGVAAAAFLLLHLPFTPASLEDLDSLNFALGVREYDVSQHQPHPPGYPLYILAAKAINAVVGDENRALSYLSIVSGALSLIALAALFRRLDRDPRSGTWALMGTALAATAPLYWFTAVRPLSDMPGLAASIAVQAFILTATTGNRLAVAAFLSGLAAGIRSQVVWLTVPLLVLVAIRRPRPYRMEDSLVALGALMAGGLMWFVPLVWVSGGPLAYWQVLSNQGMEDLTGVGMLWTTHSMSQIVLVLNSTLIAPWGTPILAGVVLVLAAAGCLRLLFGARSTLLLLIAAFGPYLVFDVLFQESVTTRYALPVVVPLAYLAVRGAAMLRPVFAATAVGLVTVAGLVLGVVNVQAFAGEPAPAFRLLQDMREGSPKLGAPPVLAMHRREQLDMRRPITWMLSELPSWADQLAATPKHEWLEVVKYFKTGAQSPVWFVADPLRSDLALIDQSGPRQRYRWPLTLPLLLGGIRPNEMDWYVFDRPSWYLGEGWALTPETAGIADTGDYGRGRQPSQGWIRRRSEPVTIVLGGRNFATDGSQATITLTIDGRVHSEFSVAPGFFVRVLTAADLSGEGDYAPVTVATTGSVAIEQFDAQAPDRAVFGYGDGWQEREYQPSTGSLWRWMGERGELRVRGTGRPLVLEMEGVTEQFSRPSNVVIRVGDREVARHEAGKSFSIQAPIPADALGTAEQAVTIETDQFYVPAELDSGSADRRHLALKVFNVSIR